MNKFTTWGEPDVWKDLRGKGTAPAPNCTPGTD